MFGVMAMLLTGVCSIRDCSTTLEDVFMGCLAGAVLWFPLVLAVVLFLGRPIAQARRLEPERGERLIGLSAAGASAASLLAALAIHAAILPLTFLLFVLVAIGFGVQTAITASSRSPLRA